MQDYFEELWRRVPADARPSDFELRRSYLLSAVARGERVLDVGCGTGEFSAELARAGAQVVAVEVAWTALERARIKHPDLDFRLVELNQPLPFEDNSFDVVWAGEVIEHVADTGRWLSELRRVLESGGRLLLSTPNHARVRLVLRGIEHFSDPLGDHLHLYTRRSLRQLLEDFGFGELDVRAVAGLPLARRTLLARGVR